MALNSSDEALQILEKALQELTKSTTLSKDTLNKINGVLGKTTKAEEENTEAVSKNTDSIAALTRALTNATKSALDFGQGVRDSREDFTSLNPAIQATGKVLSATSGALGNAMEGAGEAVSGLGNSSSKLGKGLNVLGSALKGMGKVTAAGGAAISELGVAYGEFATKELQSVVEGFREVGSVGAVGAQGMTGLYDQSIQAGISLGQFSKIVGENGQGLALSAGNTEEGAKQLAKLADNSKGFQRQMLGLGFGISEQREYQARFLKYNRLTGNTEYKNDRQLAEASRDYMKNLDMLSRITGKNRDELAKEMEERAANVRYQATLMRIESEAGPQAKKEVDKAAALFQRYIPGAAKGFQESFGGAATDAGVAFRQMAGEVGEQAQRMLEKGEITGEQAFLMVRDEMMRQQKEAGGPAMRAQQMGVSGSYDQVIEAQMQATQAQNITAESIEKAKNSQDAAQEAQDENTKKVIEAQESLQKMTNEMDKIVKDKVLPNAATIVKSYSQALEQFIKWANKTMGHGEAGGESGTPSGAGAAATQSSSAAEDMAWGGTNVAGMGSAAVPSDVSGDKTGGGSAAAGAVAGSTQQILDTIKSKESSGNYQAQAKGSSASGAYQFIDSTWQSLAKKYGIGTEFARAGDAPPQVQDAVAAKYVEDILKKTGGDVSKVPNVWYTGNTEGRMSEKALAANRGQTAAEYQSKWMDTFTKNTVSAPTTVATAQPQQMSPERVAEIKQQMFEGRKRMAFKDPNGKVITQTPGEPWAASGGVFSGPKTGYNATLHGNEAVVPLPSGDKIPVEMGGISDVMDEQVSMIADQVGRLDELAKLLRASTEISNRILRVSQV